MAAWKSRLLIIGLGVLGLLLLLPSRHGAQANGGPPYYVYLPLIGSNIGAPLPLSECPILPSDNIWNSPVYTLPVASQSITYVKTIGLSSYLHPDFGAGLYDGSIMGIPYNLVSASQPAVNVAFDYVGENDPGPYPVPTNPVIEGDPIGGGDQHMLIVDTSACKLYELYDARKSGGKWYAGSGAIFDLKSNALRPAGWTSADAAGLPILPGLVRYDEVAAGAIHHAIRFTAPNTNGTYIWPARHLTDGASGYPPMGQRFRLKASTVITGFSTANQVILTALKTYGMILADNGTAWYISGAPDSRWNNDDLHKLQTLHGSDFEAVDESSLIVSVDSGQAK